MSTQIRPGTVSASLAKDRLGVSAVIMFAMTAAAPLLVVGGLVEAGWAGTGVSGLPLAFVLIGVVLAVFAVGYVAMARHVVNAGAFYSYIALGASKPLGVGASFIALLAYNMLQVGLYGIFGVVAQGFFDEKFSVHASWWVYALVGWAIVALMGALRVDINSKIIGVLLAVEIVVVLIFDVADLAHPYKSSFALSTFAPHSLFQGGLFGAAGVAFAIVVTAFVGFEAAPVFSEESRHARRTVPAATYLAITVMGGIYMLTTWAMSVAVGAGNVVGRAQSDGPDMIFNVANKEGGLGSFVVDLGHILLITSVFAAMVSYHNSVARYSFALGREGVLPRVMGATRPRTGAPLFASATQSVVAVIVIAVFAIEGWDPLAKLFFWGGTNGGFGILVLLVGTSLSVIKFFARDGRGETAWTRVIAPLVATIALGYVLYVTTKSYNLLLGVGGHDSTRWVLPGLYLIVGVIGVLWALFLRTARRDVYDAIGLGASSGTSVAALSVSSLIPPQRDGSDAADRAENTPR
jgi:amino acid transporter